MIRNAVEQTIRDMPRVLIDTLTGRLYDKTQQAAAFEELPIFDELRSSMTTGLDHARIRREVKRFYRYVMLSHRWQPNEPTFQMVENTSMYGLPASSANSKVQRFCELVRSLKFQWAWSDTCCVNQLDKGVQQESLVAMFRWYRGSSHHCPPPRCPVQVTGNRFSLEECLEHTWVDISRIRRFRGRPILH